MGLSYMLNTGSYFRNTTGIARPDRRQRLNARWVYTGRSAIGAWINFKKVATIRLMLVNK
jgi:hypothetical protein